MRPQEQLRPTLFRLIYRDTYFYDLDVIRCFYALNSLEAFLCLLFLRAPPMCFPFSVLSFLSIINF